MSTLQAIVDRNLDAALDENGYAELIAQAAEDVAIDLLSFSSEFEDCALNEVIPLVRAWQAKKRREKKR